MNNRARPITAFADRSAWFHYPFFHVGGRQPEKTGMTMAKKRKLRMPGLVVQATQVTQLVQDENGNLVERPCPSIEQETPDPELVSIVEQARELVRLYDTYVQPAKSRFSFGLFETRCSAEKLISLINDKMRIYSSDEEYCDNPLAVQSTNLSIEQNGAVQTITFGVMELLDWCNDVSKANKTGEDFPPHPATPIEQVKSGLNGLQFTLDKESNAIAENKNKKTCRLKATLDPPTVSLDGKPLVTNLYQTAFIQLLIEKYPVPITFRWMTENSEFLNDCDPGKIGERIRDKLPLNIRDLVESKPGKGNWLKDDAWIN